MDTQRIRLAVASEGREGLGEAVGQHFGRCPAYTLIDVEAGRVCTVQVVDNPFVGGHAPGDVPRFIAGIEAKVLLTGGIGQRAITFFGQHGIEVSAGHTSTVIDAVEAWLGGTAPGASACEGHGHDDHHPHGHHGHGECGRAS
jgi:predicted Fe-Mo cluster-binding NifX family protein